MQPKQLLYPSLISLLIATLLSCNNQSRPAPDTGLLTYKIHDIRELKKAEIEIADQVYLETSKDCLLSYPQKIIENSGIIFIYSQQDKGTILLFEKASGRFILKLNQVGKGPGEYSKLRDFDTDPTTRLLYLLDQDSRILVYSYEGVFQREIKLAYAVPSELYNLSVWEGRILIDGMDNNDNSLYEFSMEGEFKRVLMKSAHLTINQQYPFTPSGNKLIFHNKICDTIFLWSQKNFKPYLCLDFGKYSLTAEEVFEAKKQKGSILSGLITKPNYRLSQFRELKNFSYFYISIINEEVSKTNAFHCFIRKSDQTILCADHSELFSGILPHGWQMMGISENQESLLCFAAPVELHEYREEMIKKHGAESLNGKYSKLNQLCNATRIDDNPVILFINLCDLSD